LLAALSASPGVRGWTQHKSERNAAPKEASVILTKFIRVIWMNDLKRRNANERKINHKSESARQRIHNTSLPEA
jgi:hypothetical protein